jgi:hypothetical protein
MPLSPAGRVYNLFVFNDESLTTLQLPTKETDAALSLEHEYITSVSNVIISGKNMVFIFILSE